MPFLQALNRYYLSHDTLAKGELSILEEVLPTYFSEIPMHPAIQALSYGETPLTIAADLLDWASLTPQESFLDLGCGCGALVLLAAKRARSALGVDLSTTAIRFAQEASQALEVTNAEFREQDLLKTDARAFDVIYCCATAVSQWLAEQLSANLDRCRPGARVITVTHPLRNDRIHSIEQRSLSFSWHRDRNARIWDFYLHEL